MTAEPPAAPAQPTPPAPGYPARDAPSANKALISSIVGLFICFILSILGIVWGYAARKEIAASGGVLGGASKATAAIVIGWIAIALDIIGAIVITLSMSGG